MPEKITQKKELNIDRYYIKNKNYDFDESVLESETQEINDESALEKITKDMERIQEIENELGLIESQENSDENNYNIDKVRDKSNSNEEISIKPEDFQKTENADSIELDYTYFKNEEGDYYTYRNFKDKFGLSISRNTYEKLKNKFKETNQNQIYRKKNKINLDAVEPKDASLYVPETYKNSEKLVLVDKDFFEKYTENSFSKEFKASRDLFNRLKRFYADNGYARFLKKDSNKEKMITSIKSFEKKSNIRKDRKDRIDELLRTGKELTPEHYSSSADELIEIRLEDFLSNTKDELLDKYGITYSTLSKKFKFMLDNGYKNVFTPKDKTKAPRIKNIEYFYNERGEKDLPGWYTKELLNKDLEMGKYMAIAQHSILGFILNDKGYDQDFKSKATERLFELAGDERFESAKWRFTIVKYIAKNFINKMDNIDKEVRIDTKNRENEDFSRMDEISANLRPESLDYETVYDILSRISPDNYSSEEQYQEDLSFAEEYLTSDYSTDAEEEEDRLRWQRELEEDTRRFHDIMNRNNINLEDFLDD